MAVPLLTTKLYMPPARTELVSRPRLVARLDQSLRHGNKLTLISAPAGFGKTTLVSEWARQTGARTAWLSLSEGDNDPARFWAYVVAALQTVWPGLGDDVLTILHAPRRQPPPIEVWLTELINELDAVCSAPLVFVLDDVHVITSSQINEGIVFLLDHLPPRMHLILTARADPPWPLARMRARREMIELRAKDLRFTLEEETSFLNDLMGLALAADDIASLDSRAEGWIAGLQMAALSMRGRSNLTGFVRGFSGSHRHILDYLMEEVLDRQATDVQTFLLRTSILDRMTAALCDAVLADPHRGSSDWDSQSMLSQLDRSNLFLIPLDEERHWYRYHHLFASLLRNHLHQTQPELEPLLRCRASEWHEQHGLSAEAVSYALAAGDAERVARLVEGNAFAMLEYGELETLLGWVEALPRQKVRARPWLCVAYAWALVYAGRIEEAGTMLEHAGKSLDGLLTDDAQDVSGHIAAVRAYGMWEKGDHFAAVEHARMALERLSERHHVARSLAATALGVSLTEGDDLSAAEGPLVQAIEAGRGAGDAHITLLATSGLAHLFIQQGRLRRADALCRDALHLTDDYTFLGSPPMPAAGSTYGVLSEVLCEWNKLQTAARMAREGVRLGKQWGQADTVTACSLQLARALSEAGDVSGALEAIEQARRVARQVSRWFASIVALTEAKVRWAYRDIAAVTRWAEDWEVRAEDQNLLQNRHTYALLSRLLIAQGRLGEATQLLERLMHQCEAIGAAGGLIGALVQHALALDLQGKTAQSLASLRRALSLAAPEGYVRTFLREGAPMGDLLSKLLAHQPDRPSALRSDTAAYASQLLGALEREMKGPRTPNQRPVVRQPLSSLVEPLTERETEVLRLLSTSQSLPEIAGRLYISVNTIRTHTKHIYAKLGVHSRIQAVERAGELGLL